jgi:ankyrin repeat protein
MSRKTCQPPSVRIPKYRAFVDQLLVGFESQGRVGAALGEAARWGHDEYLRQKIEGGINVDTPTESGGTALMFAASGGQLSTMRQLIELGADVNARDREKGMTPLIWCLASLQLPEVHLEGCRLLLDRGADPTLVATDGKNAFWWANDRDIKEELCGLLRRYSSGAGRGT